MSRPRKGSGAGHIRERTLSDGSKRWDVLTKEGGKQSTLKGGLKTLAEAESWQAEHIRERAQVGLFVPYDTGVTTVRQLGHLYLNSLTKEKLVTDKSRWAARVESAEFIDWPLTQLNEQAVSRWIDTMATTEITTGKSKGKRPERTTLQNSLNLLRGALRWAKIHGHVPVNVAMNVTIRDSTTAAVSSGIDDFDYLRVDEVTRILKSERLPQRQRVAYTLLMFTGARPKDLYLLTWDRVDVAGATIAFRTHKKSRDYLAHLLPPALDAVREWWIRSGRPSKGLMFVGPKGRPHAKGYDWGWADKMEKRHWKKLLKKTGVKKRFDSRHPAKVTPGWRHKVGITRPVALYCMRHTCASHLLLGTQMFSGGRRWSEAEIASHLGHADLTTVKRYMVALGISSKLAVEESRAALKATRGKDQ